MFEIIQPLNEVWGAGAEAIIGTGGAIFGAGAFVASAANWLHTRRVERRAAEPVAIRLVLEGEGRSIDLPLELRRRDVSRAELLGRLGMLPMREAGRRFSIRYLSEVAFMRGLNEVVDGESSILTIKCTPLEIDQFDL